ncbi:MAG: recombination protein O N-terminal domain-containing protein, partial [Ruthenibacterium sp.]
MQLITMGLVLRATKTGEADRILSVLTPDKGIISAVAKSSLRLKSKLFSGTGLFCYSEFTLFEGKTMYVVDAATVQNVFFGLHENVESMALAMYFSEIAAILS